MGPTHEFGRRQSAHRIGSMHPAPATSNTTRGKKSEARLRCLGKDIQIELCSLSINTPSYRLKAMHCFIFVYQ